VSADERPVIGLTCYLEPATWGSWQDVPAAILPQKYLDKIEQAGGIGLLIPPPPVGSSGQLWAASVLSRLDGLLVSGGSDVDPARYAALSGPKTQRPQPDRDEAEIALVTAAIDHDLPLLGICRGMQVMAVASGGSLEQHLPDRVGDLHHGPAPGQFGEHPITLDPASRIGAILGDSIQAPSAHHQAVVEHPGYQASGWDPADDTIEAMERPDSRFCLAVQWHPEAGNDLRLFKAFIDAARR
jgi:putative glutamine amidotransferase